ncbi:MFS transporter [Natrinema sp. 1APR25-10V2]|uniref:MFS transporter n=1 Tax=Natrinema sp. 1APR25-10V2 TaxID=2951081 RepID=UPI0028764260|nr:MFS transporter [Natrinema sp. 1APR25-10V2]MDS0477031.1 MFS transporter [Natrinema sp. 1APR25-10V2]
MVTQRTRAGVFAACFLASAGMNAYMIAPASIIPLLVEAFDVDKAGAGIAISAAVLGSVVVQIPFGFLMDRYDNRLLMTAGTAVFVPVAIAGSFATSYPLFLVSRAVAGVAGGAVFVLGTNVVAQVFAGERQGVVTTVFIASAPLGFAISQFGGPLLAAAFGWQAVFVAYPLLSALGYLVFRLSRPTAIRTGDRTSIREFGNALRNRAVLLVSLSGFCSYVLYIFMNSWMPTYATERLPLTLGEAGAITALLPAVGMLARPAGGWLSDYVGYRRRLIVVCSLAFALPAFFIVSRTISMLLFSAVMLGVGFSLQFGMGVYYVYTRELAADGTGGTSLAVFTSIAFSGTLVSPTLGGWLIGAFSWEMTFFLYALIGIAGIGVLFLTRDSSPGPTG